MLFVADAELGDQRADRFQDRVESVTIPRQDHPGRERSRAFAVKSIKRSVDDLASFRFACASTGNRFGDAARYAVRNRFSQFCLKASGRSEMMEKVGVSPSDLRGYRLEGNCLRPLFEQQQACRFQCGRSAFFGVQAFAAY